MARSGRTIDARNFTQAEDDCIRLCVQTGGNLVKLAAHMGRSRSGIYRRYQKLRAEGFQTVMDLGQIGGAHDRAE